MGPLLSFDPLSPEINIHVLLSFLQIFLELILVGRILFGLVIISLILMSYTFDQVVILQGEITCLSLFGRKKVKSSCFYQRGPLIFFIKPYTFKYNGKLDE